MKVVFVSNYFSHHQLQFSEAMAGLCDYTFIATQPIPEDRKTLGWGSGLPAPEYVLEFSDATRASVIGLIDTADVLIAGSAPESLIHGRISAGKLVFRYSERPLKHGAEPQKFMPRLVRWNLRNPARKPVYLLCASAYAAADYARFGLFRSKRYQWGYFPPLRRYTDVQALMDQKDKNRILWCGRFLDWKHPDDALRAARMLKDAGYRFDLEFVGTGPMEDELHTLCTALGLEGCVRFCGAMPPEEVRNKMERTGIVWMTSDRQEGWGAVLNEAMNSGCAVLCSHLVGAAPYLIEHGKNGALYPSGNAPALAQQTLSLLTSPAQQESMGVAAYRTIAEVWNAQTAAERLVAFSGRLLSGEPAAPYESGPLCRAPKLADDWFRDESE